MNQNLSPALPLNEDQTEALRRIKVWLTDPGDPFFVLKGYAGTGKTFLLQEFLRTWKAPTAFTAPTNKATRVLRQTLTRDDYRPNCRTIYSLLGLTMQANGEVKELSEPEDPVDLSDLNLIVVDEASMVGAKLMRFIESVADEHCLKFLFLGDPMQLPPVGESLGAPFRVESSTELRKIMRYDNAILDLVTAIREQIPSLAPRITLKTNKSLSEGVEKVSASDFMAQLFEHAKAGDFLVPEKMKAIAWTNIRVDALNRAIRMATFGQAFAEHWVPWVETDRVIFTAPGRDLENRPMVATDDEGTVTRVKDQPHPLYRDFQVKAIDVTLDNDRVVTAFVLAQESLLSWEQRKKDLAAEAKIQPRRWKDFWSFVEAFHSLRHAYAITAHRSQGSTYEHVFVDSQNILGNRNRNEAFKCLYVACSRPKKFLTIL